MTARTPTVETPQTEVGRQLLDIIGPRPPVDAHELAERSANGRRHRFAAHIVAIEDEAVAGLLAERDRLLGVVEAAQAAVTFCNCGPDIAQGHEDACIQAEPEMASLRRALDALDTGEARRA